MLDSMSMPGVREVLEWRKPWFDSRFVDYIEKESPVHDVQPSSDEYL